MNEDDRPDDDLGVPFEEPPAAGGRRRKRRGLPGCLAVIVALAVVLGGLYLGVTKGVEKIQDQFQSADDYPGPGKGKINFQVKKGASVAAIGRALKDQGVVASVDAFTEAATANPDSTGIQVGYYGLVKEMKASDALEILVNPDNILTNTVTIPEGLRVVDIVAILVDKTKFSKAQFTKVLDQPDKLGLPSFAKGNPEGYLFPSTYDFGPNDTPATMLKDMVTRWDQAATDNDLAGAAERLGYSQAELMTVASLVEAEGVGDDMPKIARVIYNRIENPGTAGTIGRLQIDATVNYAADNKLGAVPTQADLAIDSPYNTYTNTGLPPGPIEAPGDDAIAAATNPAEGDWYYYVTVNLKTGLTKFAETYDQFLADKDELRQYCETESAGAC